MLLGSCGGSAFSGGERAPSGSGGTDAGHGGAPGEGFGGGAGATGGSAQGAGGPSGAGGDGAAGDGAAGDGRGTPAGAGESGQGVAAGEGGQGGGGAGHECNVTCCNGEERVHTTIDEALCVSSASADDFCDERGGPQRAELDGALVWEDHECALGEHNCVATCCDGSRSYLTQEAENECAFYALYACEHDGGPTEIEFEGASVFMADVECPSARTCVLECCDGFQYDRSPGFGTSNCVFFNATSSVCADEGHGANQRVLFGGDVVWEGTCP